MVHDYAVLGSEEVYRGRLFALRRDEVAMPHETTAVREVLVHPGAVVVAPVDENGCLVGVRQYRHPLRRRLWELPAGLLDVDGEPPHVGAARELAEETGLVATQWDVLVDLASSPGISTETLRIYLARGLRPVPEADRHVAAEEEAEMTVVRIPLPTAVEQVMAGEIENAPAVAGVLAAARAQARDWVGLRPVDAPWPARDRPTGPDGPHMPRI